MSSSRLSATSIATDVVTAAVTSEDRAWSAAEIRFLAGALLVALVMRLLHWQSLAPYPWFDFLGLDAKYYDEWARRLLTEGLQGKDPYFMGPLYPHVLALVYKIGGVSFGGMRLIQVVLSTATVALVHQLGRVYGGPRLACVASGMAAVYGPLVYYSVSLLYPTITAFLATLLLLSLQYAAARRSLAWAAAAGATMGTFALGRGNILLFAPVAFFWLVFAWGRPFAPRISGWKQGVPAGLALTAATILLILPATVHNLRAGDVTLLTTNGGLNLYIGNGPMARGGHETPVLHIPRPDGSVEVITADLSKDVECRTEAEYVTGRSMSYPEVSNFYLELTRHYIASDPGAFVSRLVMKFTHFWSTYEIPQIEHFGYFRQFSMPLQGPVFSFGILGPLAIVGMAFAARRRGHWALPFLFVGAYSFAVILFFVLARYRLPIVPALFLFAAVGVLATWDAVRERRALVAGLAVAGAVAIGLLMRANFYGVDESKGVAQILYRHGIVADANRDWEAAIGHYRTALALKPEYAKCHLNLGVALARVGRADEGMEHLQAAERFDPAYHRAPYNRGLMLEVQDRIPEAAQAYRRAVELEPRYLVARMALAEVLLVEGDDAGAVAELAAITAYDDRWTSDGHVQASSRAAVVQEYLAKCEAAVAAGERDCFGEDRDFRRAELARLRGAGPEALARLGRYFEAGGDCAGAYVSLGELLTVAAEWEGAQDAYRRALEASPGIGTAHLGLARVAAVRGDAETALAELDAEMQASPDDPAAYLEAGLVQERLNGDPAAAQGWFDRYLRLGGRPDVLEGRRSNWQRRQGAGS